MIIDELFEGPQMCPECGGISFSDLILAEKKDACYYKVKASAKVWPSAYASGRLVQCRKKGASNYGNKSEGVAEGWKDVVAGGALALGALGAGAQTMPNINAQQVELTNKYYNALVQRAKEDGRELDRRTLNFLKAKAEDAAALKLQQASPKKQQGFPAQGSERRVSRNIDNFESQGVAEEQELDEKWSQKYKSSINCANPKGFSQKAHCAGRKKNENVAEGALDDSNFGKSAALMTPSPQAAQQAKDIVQKQADANVISQAQIAGAAPVTREGEQQKGADYRDPKEVDYDDEYDAMVARVKKLAGLGPMKTVYDPTKRQYRNMPTAVQPKK
jgi:hypothetical protein